MSIHNGPRLNLMRDRLEQGKCCACGKNNPLKEIQILCPECMGKSRKKNLPDNFYNKNKKRKKTNEGKSYRV